MGFRREHGEPWDCTANLLIEGPESLDVVSVTSRRTAFPASLDCRVLEYRDRGNGAPMKPYYGKFPNGFRDFYSHLSILCS